MRIAVLDIGSNSIRIYVADASDDPTRPGLTDRYRRSMVTRLAEGVERSGRLSPAAVRRTLEVLDGYHAALAEHQPQRAAAVLTSAVRDASNGPEFAAEIEQRYAVAAWTLEGRQEADFTFRGALSEHDVADSTPTLVIDIGGGSTELIIGRVAAAEPAFAISMQAGVVRFSERHLHSDPPTQTELQELRKDMRALLNSSVPASVRSLPMRAIAVAGTATSAAAADQALEPYDPTRVQGYELGLPTLNLLLARLAALALAQRREVRGLHPDRAGVIVAGLAMLVETLGFFSLPGAVASEHDILRGVALHLAAQAQHG